MDLISKSSDNDEENKNPNSEEDDPKLAAAAASEEPPRKKLKYIPVGISILLLGRDKELESPMSWLLACSHMIPKTLRL